MKIMTNYIPIYEFAKLKKTSVQNVYRWIREGKIKEEDVEKVKVEVERIKINPEVDMVIRKRN